MTKVQRHPQRIQMYVNEKDVFMYERLSVFRRMLDEYGQTGDIITLTFAVTKDNIPPTLITDDNIVHQGVRPIRKFMLEYELELLNYKERIVT